MGNRWWYVCRMLTSPSGIARPHSRLWSTLLYVFFAIYLILLIYFLFLARIGFQAAGLDYFAPNLIPFATLRVQIAQLGTPARYFAIPNLLANLFAFTPLGIYLPLLWRSKRVVTYLCTFLIIGVLAEVIQGVFRLGSADIDDLILYIIGGIIGWLIYKALSGWLKDEYRIRIFVAIAATVFGAVILAFVLHLYIQNQYLNRWI